MALQRMQIEHFILRNDYYAGAVVTYYVADDDGEATTTKATLYSSLSGSETLSNPQTLNSEGKFAQAVYVEQRVIASIVRSGETYVTGVFQPVNSSANLDEVELLAASTRAAAYSAERAAARAAAAQVADPVLSVMPFLH